MLKCRLRRLTHTQCHPHPPHHHHPPHHSPAPHHPQHYHPQHHCPHHRPHHRSHHRHRHHHHRHHHHHHHRHHHHRHHRHHHHQHHHHHHHHPQHCPTLSSHSPHTVWGLLPVIVFARWRCKWHCITAAWIRARNINVFSCKVVASRFLAAAAVRVILCSFAGGHPKLYWNGCIRVAMVNC